MSDAQSVTISEQACSECVFECPNPLCSGFTPQCTEKCVVVPCNDSHEGDSCSDVVCDDQDCISSASGIEDFIQCCDDYHAYFSDPKASLDSPMQFAWDPAFAAILHSDFSSQQPMQQLFNNSEFSHPNNAVSPSLSEVSSLDMESHSEIENQAAYQLSNPSFHSLNHQSLSSPQAQAQMQHHGGHVCMWGDCNAMFHSLEMLISHVNLHHLRFSSPNHSQLTDQQVDLSNLLSCHWGDCQVYPNPALVPGSSENPVGVAIGVLASHLYYDHLGLYGDIPKPPLLDSTSSVLSSMPPQSLGGVQPTADIQPSTSNPLTPPAEHDCCSVSVHTCKWKACFEAFDTCEALMEHIGASHVGGGKKHYDCYWEGCRRNGDNGFPSKQKICRHIQSHTGHRPYQCELCNQNFSEAATLQQHMRRHTQEKPYHCDFPGCKKAFAIAGALTIHKRTHNGDKPFKCTHCSKAFAESSNLSKHLRTHTGARPYACTEPGCGKSFARGDQLTRHMGVHQRKASSTRSATPAESVDF